MLINWFVSAFSDGHYLRHVVTSQDLKILATQFCTHLLAAGVIRQIEDVNAPMELLFRVRLIYTFNSKKYYYLYTTSAYSTVHGFERFTDFQEEPVTVINLCVSN